MQLREPEVEPAVEGGTPADFTSNTVSFALRNASAAGERRPSEEELLAIMAHRRALTPPGPRTSAEDLVREGRDSRRRSLSTRAPRRVR